MKIWVLIISVFISSNLFADVVVAPKELGVIKAKISQRQQVIGRLPQDPAKIVYKENQIVFIQNSGKDVLFTFNTKASTIEKHIQIKSSNDGYAFVMTLENVGQAYQCLIEPISGADALFCFNDKEVFAYTQQEGIDGILELKEWIYAKASNTRNGSEWSWVFKSEPWQWPLTVSLAEDGKANINRNMPFAGIPIEGKARSQYMLNMMVMFKREEPVKKYFPFEEKVVSLEKPLVTNKEGLQKEVDVNIQNIAIDNNDRPKQKVGLDFNRWDEHWHSLYTIRVMAKPDEYPLLIE